MANFIKKIKREKEPDLLFIEPYELVVTSEMHKVLPMAMRDVRYDVGPFITLIDGPSFPFLWEERSMLLLKHIKGADRVFINRVDMMDSEALESVGSTLADVVEENPMPTLGLPRDDVFSQLMNLIC